MNLLKKDVLEQKNESSEIRKDLNDMKETTNSMRAEQSKEAEDLRKETNKLVEKTAHLTSKDDFNAIRESQVEIQSRLSDVSKELQLLTGRFDENRYFMEKTLKDSTTERELIKAQIMGIEGQVKDIKDRLSALENPIRQPKEPTKEQQKEIGKKAEEPPKDKIKMYEAAYNAFENKKYKEAREKFEAFIKEFPKDEVTDNAQFWIAETYYGEKDFEGAILAYETLLKKYPNSEKAPTALLKQGLSFIEMGDKKTGKVILEQLRERYPNSKETGVAKKKIEEIEKKTGKKKK
ncbi:MAG: tol-pal system protein YbgF [Nitrospirota bacterium]